MTSKKSKKDGNECLTLEQLWDFISDNRQAIFGSFRMASMHSKVCVIHAGENYPLIQHIKPDWGVRKNAVVYIDPQEFEDPRNYHEFEMWLATNNPNKIVKVVDEESETAKVS